MRGVRLALVTMKTLLWRDLTSTSILDRTAGGQSILSDRFRRGKIREGVKGTTSEGPEKLKLGWDEISAGPGGRGILGATTLTKARAALIRGVPIFKKTEGAREDLGGVWFLPRLEKGGVDGRPTTEFNLKVGT